MSDCLERLSFAICFLVEGMVKTRLVKELNYTCRSQYQTGCIEMKLLNNQMLKAMQ